MSQCTEKWRVALCLWSASKMMVCVDCYERKLVGEVAVDFYLKDRLVRGL